MQSFSKDTKIISVDGKSYTIEEIIDNYSKGERFYTLACDPDTKLSIPVEGMSPQCTGTTDTWYNITLDNGRSVKVTPDHLMMLSNGEFMRADKLEVSQSLMPVDLNYEYHDLRVEGVDNSGEYRAISSEAYDKYRIQYENSKGKLLEVKVSKIEVINLDNPEPKYDLHIPYYENFALDCGVFTHNSSGSYMGGNVLYEVNKYLTDNNMKSKCILFIHDSIEIDIHPDEFLHVASVILPLMNKYPLDEFGIPTKADLVVGPSLGQELECTNIEVSDDYNEGTMDVEGYLDDFQQLVDNWGKVYKLVEYVDITDPVEESESWSQFFVSKRAINKYYGKSRTKINRRIHIIIK